GRRAELVAAATDGAALAALAAAWRAAGVPTATHGELSRHPARTAAERKAAVHFLFGLIRKAQDTWLVRNVNRKVSYPFTRLLLPVTWLSPNMISIIVFFIGVAGCVIWMTPTYLAGVEGASLLLFAGYLDGCDGEIARLRLESSKLGAWIDTMADEATTVISVATVGVHVLRVHPSEWLWWIVVIAPFLSAAAVLSIYYYLLTSGAGSGNSQDYPTTNPILKFLRLLIRREAINLGAFFLCLLGLIDVFYAFLALGALVSSSVLVTQQVQRVRAKRAPVPADEKVSPAL
ncbi:MAG: CDP-alcohol phosphatidyltransferase family protein, partial [Deltaproteobacteria bacterium]|nr:CDP-alcohol phosphatidyltransferase family protein [Deltaproteobacteria bacterium]